MDFLKRTFPISKRDTYSENFRHLELHSNDKILDIGADTSLVLRDVFPKPVYVAVEPKKTDNLNKLRIGDELFHDTWPAKDFSHKNFDCIFLLTVLDEIKDKEKFLAGIIPHMDRQTKLFVAVRNKDFPFRLSNYVSTIDGDQIQDLGTNDYNHLVKENFIIRDVRPFLRPISFVSLKAFFKTILIRFTTVILPTKYTYMTLLELTLK